jgi:hypothetical protein
MKFTYRLTALALAASLGVSILSVPVAARASEEGKRNTAIGLGAAAAALLLTQKDKLPGLLAAGGAAYAYSKYNDDVKARHRREREYGYYDNRDNYRYNNDNSNYRDNSSYNRDNYRNQSNDNSYRDNSSYNRDNYRYNRDNRNNGDNNGSDYRYNHRHDPYNNDDSYSDGSYDTRAARTHTSRQSNRQRHRS